MKIIGAFIAGFMLASAMAFAGSYAITLTTTAATDTIVPVFVAQYNATHGTNYTGLQWATKVCNDTVEQRAKALLEIMGQ